MNESPRNDSNFDSAQQAPSYDVTVDVPPSASQDGALKPPSHNDATVDASPAASQDAALRSGSFNDATVDAPPDASQDAALQSGSFNDATVDAPPEPPPDPSSCLTIDHPSRDHQSTQVKDIKDFEGEDASFDLSDGSVQVEAKPKVQIANYEILGVLGRGAVGVVYKARQMGLNRLVALKMLLAGSHAGQRELARFRIEAEAVARLRHPNIVQVYEVGEHNGLPFFSLEFVEGGSLHSKLDGKPLPPRVGAEIMEALCRAMHYAHQNNIIHRDLKPANVLMTPDGVPKITDFGLAKRLEDSEESSQTRTGTLMGTPSYMPPEQAEGRTHDIGPLSDQYTLGAILYELLTGRPPFLGATLLETIQQVRNQEPVPPTQLQATTPRDLEVICLKALQKERGKRYADAGEMADDLHRFLTGEPIKARPVSKAERLWRWCKRNPKLAAATAAILLLLVVVSVVSTWAAITIRAEKEIAIKQKDRAEENEQKAKANEKVANEQADLALGTISDLINQFQIRLSTEPGVKPLRRDLMMMAMERLKHVIGGDAGKLRRNTADVYKKAGELALELGNTAEANQYLQHYYEIAKAALSEDPNNDFLRLQLAWACRHLGQIYYAMHDLKKSLAYHQEAVIYRKELADVSMEERRRRNELVKEEDRTSHYRNQVRLSEEYYLISIIYYYMGDSAHAEEPVRKSLAIREKLQTVIAAAESAWLLSGNPPMRVSSLTILAATPRLKELADESRLNLAYNYHVLAEIYFHLQNLGSSRFYYQKCEEMQEEIFREDEKERAAAGKPQNFHLIDGLSDFHQMYAAMLLSLGAPLKEVLRHNDRALELSRRAVSIEKVPSFQQNLAKALYSRGLVALRASDGTGAKTFFHECLKIREELANKDPENRSKKIELLQVLPRCGQHERASRLAEELRKGHEQDAALLIAVAGCYAGCFSATTDDIALRRSYLERALEDIQAAVKNGYKDLFTLETDPDLEPIRRLPAFKQTLDKIKTGTAPAAKAS